MGNLANTYSALGRHQDALNMMEKTLEFKRRVLPENHPDLGIAFFNIGFSYHRFGDIHRALNMAREALRIFQATLPPTHPHLQQAREVVRQFEGDSARRA